VRPDESGWLDLGPRGESGPGQTIDDPVLHRMQRRHFLLYDVLPLFGTVAALVLAARRPVTGLDLALFGAFWLLTGIGLSAGFHRLFAHRSYRAKPALRVALAVLGSAAAQGTPLSWAAMHRRHHELSDRPGDLHSPNLHGKTLAGRIRGFLHAHYTWMFRHEYPKVTHYTPDLLRDPLLMQVARRYRLWIALGLALPAALGGALSQSWMGALTGFLWGGVVRIFVVGHSMWAINSFTHTMGSKAFPIPRNPQDESRNSPLLALLAWGEGWHNNHHAFPASAWFGLAWHRVDLGFWAIRGFELLGLASDVKVPTRQQIVARAGAAARAAVGSGSSE
jgi:stearoyl-CoA desaturase (delta-9 desaturase)